MADGAAVRRGLLAKVHIAKSDLAMADSSYRALLMRAGGADSAAKLSVQALERALAEFRRLGWAPKRGRRPAKSGAPAQRRKIHRLLAEMGLQAAYAEGILRRMFGAEARLGMASPAQLRAVTAALVKRRQKEEA